MLLSLIFIVYLIGSSREQNLLSTHFTAARALGYKTLEYRYVVLKHTTGDLSEAKENIALIPPTLALLTSQPRFKDAIIEPLFGQIHNFGKHLKDTVALIELLDTLADKTISREKRDTLRENSYTKREVNSDCTHVTTLNVTKIDTAILGSVNLILYAKEIIYANTDSATTFKSSETHYLASALMTSAHELIIEVQQDLDIAKERLLYLFQNTLNSYYTTTLNSMFCMTTNVDIINDVNVESCAQQNRQIVCSVQVTLGKVPTLTYHLKPYRYDGCYIDRTFYMDGQTNVYAMNDRGIITSSSPDLCAQGIISSNVSAIKANCPLNLEHKTWEFGHKILVIHQLTDELVTGMRNNSWKVVAPPFTLREGTYEIKLDHVTYHIKHSSQTLIEPSMLPFSRLALCPPHPITSYFSYAYMSIHWPAFIFNTMLLTIVVTISIVSIRWLANRCCRKSTPNPADIRDREMMRLLALSHNAGRLRRTNIR